MTIFELYLMNNKKCIKLKITSTFHQYVNLLNSETMIRHMQIKKAFTWSNRIESNQIFNGIFEIGSNRMSFIWMRIESNFFWFILYANLNFNNKIFSIIFDNKKFF